MLGNFVGATISYSLNLGLCRGYYRGVFLEVIKRDTRSLGYSS